jgi:hypothetical protein
MTSKKPFKHSIQIGSDNGMPYHIYQSTIQLKAPNTVWVSDNYAKKIRKRVGGLDADFVVRGKRRMK